MTDEIKNEKKHNTDLGKWAKLLLGVVLTAAGLYSGIMWGSARDNYILAFIFVVLAPVGAFISYKALKSQNSGNPKFDFGVKVEKNANCFDLITGRDPVTNEVYALEAKFSYDKDWKKGIPFYVDNLKQFIYYRCIHFFDLTSDAEEPEHSIRPFLLRDSRYLDPKQLNIPLNMKCNKEYEEIIKTDSTLKETIKIGSMVIGLVITTLLLIATTPPPGA